MNAILALFACVAVAELSVTSGAKSLTSRRLSCPAVPIANGRSRYRQRSGFVQFQCNKSYILAGEKYMKCVHGKWEGEIPTCVRSTCKSISMPKNGFVYPSHRGGVLNFFCRARYDLHGPRVVYCDGKKWSSYLPSCIESTRNASLSCDFEHEDICGWSHDINHDFDWTRLNNTTPSWHVGTGPSHDHTFGKFGKGYYMYIESTSKMTNDQARLISPVYKKQNTNTCLEFFYHMHGATMGELRVYMKKVNDSWDLSPSEAYFTVSGNQGDAWKRSFIQLGTIDDDFQIIMEGVRGTSYLSDIAIDDVQIIENCVEEPEPTSSISTTDVTEEDFTYESCSSRCGIKHGNSSLCDCDDTCFLHGSCCADYISVCLLSDFTSLGDYTDESYTVAASADPEMATEFEDEEDIYIETTSTTESPSTIHPTSPAEMIPTKSEVSSENPATTTTGQPEILITSRKPVAITTKKPVTTTTKKPAITTTKKPVITTSKKRVITTSNKPAVITTKKPWITITKKLVINMFSQSSIQNKTSTTTIKPKIPYIIPIFTNKSKQEEAYPKTIKNITKLPVRLPNYNKSYKNKQSFKEKENDYYKYDMLTLAPNTDDKEIVEVMSTQAPKKLASLLQVEVDSKEKDSNGEPPSGIIFVSVGLLCVGILLAVYLVKRKSACKRIKRIRNGYYGDSASDVRFLTSDEMLDFTLATPN